MDSQEKLGPHLGLSIQIRADLEVSRDRTSLRPSGNRTFISCKYFVLYSHAFEVSFQNFPSSHAFKAMSLAYET